MRRISLLLTIVLALAGFARESTGCPLCNPAGLTLSEQLAQADVSVLVQWVESQSPNTEQGFAGATTYEVVEAITDAARLYKPGDRIVLSRERSGKPGDLFILLGAGETDVLWDTPLAVTETSYQYIRQAPSKESPSAERLKYFARFLEYPDQMVSDDAYSEFASAPYQQILPIQDSLSREDLRKWVSNPDTSKMRLGLYGLLLGLCGNDDDAQLLREIIEQPAPDLRLGIDGIMGGYVLLTGADGLEVIDAKLRDQNQSLSEAYSAMQVLRFLWTYAPERVPAERLRASMRTLLGRSDLADLAITDLTRWEDWSIIDRLIEMYEQPEFASAHIQKSILRFCLVAERVKPELPGGPAPETAKKAQALLAQVAETDPKSLENAKRLFFVN